jgi:uncharacterized SAM-binding protein YcdF (DUF218 family)
MAHVQGWRRVIVVTSTYHVTRARLLIARCLHRDFAVVAARPTASLPLWWWRKALLHEWAGLVDAELHRGC